MNIITTWAWDPKWPDEAPALVASFDEYTGDAWSGIPAFYAEDIAKYKASVEDRVQLREIVIEIPDGVVRDAFKVPVVQGTAEVLTEESLV